MSTILVIQAQRVVEIRIQPIDLIEQEIEETDAKISITCQEIHKLKK
jgi:hypothetical protein